MSLNEKGCWWSQCLPLRKSLDLEGRGAKYKGPKAQSTRSQPELAALLPWFCLEEFAPSHPPPASQLGFSFQFLLLRLLQGYKSFLELLGTQRSVENTWAGTMTCGRGEPAWLPHRPSDSRRPASDHPEARSLSPRDSSCLS